MKSRSFFFAATVLLAPMPFSAMAHETQDIQGGHHHQMAATPEITRRIADYTVPAIQMLRDDGKPVLLSDEINDGRPVVLAFIYTSCTTVCPMTSATLAQFQRELGADRDHVHIVSISIDPEQDTPAVLAAYARKYGAGPQWNHYTGTVANSIEAQRAFDMYRGDKMNHNAVFLLRASVAAKWIRIEGFATPEQLLREFRDMLASK